MQSMGGEGWTLRDYLSVPYVLVVESYPESDGDWSRRAYYPELPGCVAEGTTTVELFDALDRLRVTSIVARLKDGTEVPVPREPVPRLDVEELLMRTGLTELLGQLDIRSE
jgi:predicted RNase H-like HicB family nuclease